MALPVTIPCPFCNVPVPVTKSIYQGTRQPDPAKDGVYVYQVSGTCPQCKTVIVVSHQEPQPL